MNIQRLEDEVIIKIPDAISVAELQHVLDYVKFRMVELKDKQHQQVIDLLAKQVNKTWWEQNQHKFLNPSPE